MKRAIMLSAFIAPVLLLALAVAAAAQQNPLPLPNAGQAARPAASSNGPGTVGLEVPSAPVASGNVPPAPNTAGNSGNSAAPDNNAANPDANEAWNAPAANSVSKRPATITSSESVEDNPYDPYLEPPPLPKGKPTLIGGIAARVDHVRNRLTIQPFGGGKNIKVFVDERSHIYRNGVETTVLGIHRGDRVYVDTMLDGDKIFARNVRVLTETGLAEVREQVIAADWGKGTISVRDQLSAKPVTFAVSGATRYSSSKGPATAGDVQPGSLIDVQFAPRFDNRDVAQEVIVLAKPGDNYIFSGVVTDLNMSNHSFFVDKPERRPELRSALQPSRAPRSPCLEGGAGSDRAHRLRWPAIQRHQYPDRGRQPRGRPGIQSAIGAVFAIRSSPFARVAIGLSGLGASLWKQSILPERHSGEERMAKSEERKPHSGPGGIEP